MHQRDIVLFALVTGLRQSNVLGLEWSHVNLDTGHAWVGAAQSKSRRPIAVPKRATAATSNATVWSIIRPLPSG